MAEKKKGSKLKVVIIVVVVLIVLAAIGGSMGGGNSSSSDSSKQSGAATEQSQQSGKQEEEKKPAEPYTISEEKADTSNEFMYQITGTLVNNTDSDKSYIQVQYTLYDASGAQVGTALANTNNLKAGGTWKFKAVGDVEPSKVAKFERSDVSGF